MKIDVKVSQVDVWKVKTALSEIKNGGPKAIVSAINKTLPGVRTDATKEVGRVLNLPAKKIRETFKVLKASLSMQGGRVWSSGKPVSLHYFTGTRQTQKGTSVKVLRSSSRSVIPHAFMPTMPKGGKGVFRRQMLGKKRAGRLPIERLEGPRVQDILDDEPVLKVVESKAGDRLQKNLDHEVGRLLAGLR